VPEEATDISLTVYFRARNNGEDMNNIDARIKLINDTHTYTDPFFHHTTANFTEYAYTWEDNPSGGAWTIDQINGIGTYGLDQFGIYCSDISPGIDVSAIWAEVSYTVPGNWNTPQTITVTGVDDADADGNIPYTISITGAAGDINYNSYVTSVDATNNDNDVSVGPVNPNVSTVTVDLEYWLPTAATRPPLQYCHGFQ
jgi:hypothetical protein